MNGIFLDIETTGLSTSIHVPLDIALKVLDLSSGKELASYQSLVKWPLDVWERRDPTSIEINGFTLVEMQAGKDVLVVGQEIIALLSSLNITRGSSFFICQNPSFDRGFFNQLVSVYLQEKMNWPYHWLDLASMFWARYIQQLRLQAQPIPENISLSKNTIAGMYHLPPEKSPHRAMQGVEHLIACYQAVVGF